MDATQRRGLHVRHASPERSRARTVTEIYIISPEGADRPCKVGISENPWARCAGMQTGSPVRLRVREVYPFENRCDAAAMERQFHESHKPRLVHGEWFDIDFDDANYWLFENVLGDDVDAFRRRFP